MGGCESRHSDIAKAVIAQGNKGKAVPQASNRVGLSIDLKPLEKDEQPSTYTSIPELEENQGRNCKRGANLKDSAQSAVLFDSISSVPERGPDVYVSPPSDGLSESIAKRWNNSDFNPDVLFASQNLNKVFMVSTRNGAAK